MKLSEEHVLAALEGYMKSLSMIDDDAVVVSVKRNRDNTFEIEVEHED
jgi:hypothetical protein